MSPFSPFQDSDFTIRFAHREEAGDKLAQAVLTEISQHPVPDGTHYVVYGLPRGGVPIAHPIASLLQCPLDIIVAKKITQPDNSELAIGAVTADGHVVWSPSYRICPDPATGKSVEQATRDHYRDALSQAQIHAQTQLTEFESACPQADPAGAIAFVVDDGIATGMTIAAAVKSLRARQPAQIWICAPLAPLDMMPFLRGLSDRLIILATPHPFYSVSRFYGEFPQVTNEEVKHFLQQQTETDR